MHVGAVSKRLFYRHLGGLSRWGSSGRADIFELYLWWLKHKIPPRDLLSPHRSPKKPIMGVGGGEGGGRKVGSHYSFISFLSAPENAPPSEKAQKCQIEAWKRDLSQKWVSTIWSSFASIHQLCHQRRKIGTETGRGKKQLCLPPPASLSRPLLTFPENAGSLSCAKLSNPLWERNNCPHSF